jgi:hypothetical protein
MMTTYKRPITYFPKQTIEIIMSSLEMFVMCLIQVFIVKAMQEPHEFYLEIPMLKEIKLPIDACDPLKPNVM